jgi:hypothetical protein
MRKLITAAVALIFSAGIALAIAIEQPWVNGDAVSTANPMPVEITTDGAAVSMTNPVQTYQSNSYLNITTNTTTTVKSGAGTLACIAVNTKGASSNTATIYDNTAGSGTLIGKIDTTTAVGVQCYNVAFGTGLTIVTATGTGADLTVSYR